MPSTRPSSAAPSAPSCDDLLACAMAAARAAGDHALANYSRRREAVQRDRHDIKLKLDIECQAIAAREVHARYPPHRFLGEEDWFEQAAGALADPPERIMSDDFLWIVDPIDGTVNFSHGYPYWCCSVAVRRGETDLAGVVYSPVRGECYAAAADRPATCNGEAIRVSDTRELVEAIVLTGTSADDEGPSPSFDLFRRITARVQRPRIQGSAALDICQVAHGRADGYFERGVHIWDVAAAGLILRQAGGTAEIVERLQKPHALAYVASNGHVHAQLKRAVGNDPA